MRDLGVEAILNTVPGIRMASPEDNAALLQLLAEAPMASNSLQIGYRRDPDFFSFLDLQGDKQVVILAEGEGDATQSLNGMSSMTFRPGMIAGKRERVGYLGDLRLKFHRRTLRNWKRLYGNVLGELAGEHQADPVRYFLTAVLDENLIAQKSLVENRSAPFRYEPLTRYNIVHLMARYPWAPFYSSAATVVPATTEDEQELIRFLDREHRGRPFGYCFADHEWQFRRNRWNGWRLDKFRIIRDPWTGRIIACCAPFSPHAHKKVVVESLPSSWQLVQKSWRAIMGNSGLPAPGEELRILHLTHLCFANWLTEAQRSDCLRALVDETYAEAKLDGHGYHMVAFADFLHRQDADALGHYVSHKLPATLFAVRHESTPSLRRQAGRDVGFEMALV